MKPCYKMQVTYICNQTPTQVSCKPNHNRVSKQHLLKTVIKKRKELEDDVKMQECKVYVLQNKIRKESTTYKIRNAIIELCPRSLHKYNGQGFLVTHTHTPNNILVLEIKPNGDSLTNICLKYKIKTLIKDLAIIRSSLVYDQEQNTFRIALQVKASDNDGLLDFTLYEEVFDGDSQLKQRQIYKTSINVIGRVGNAIYFDRNKFIMIYSKTKIDSSISKRLALDIYSPMSTDNILWSGKKQEILQMRLKKRIKTQFGKDIEGHINVPLLVKQLRQLIEKRDAGKELTKK